MTQACRWVRLSRVVPVCVMAFISGPFFFSQAEASAIYDISFTVNIGPGIWSFDGSSHPTEDLHKNPHTVASIDPPGTPGAAASASMIGPPAPFDTGPMGYSMHVSGNSVLIPEGKVTAQSIAFEPAEDGTVFLSAPQQVVPASHVVFPVDWTWSIHLVADNPDEDFAQAAIRFGVAPISVGVSGGLGFSELVSTHSTFDDSGSESGLLDISVDSFVGAESFRLRLSQSANGIAVTQIPNAATWLLLTLGLAAVSAIGRKSTGH